jgi:methyl-accepting chemotaxis protein
LKIGLRLSVGFGAILLCSAAMMTAVLVSGGSERKILIDTLQHAASQQYLAEEMRQELLNSAIAVRNMDLRTKVDDVQKDEAQAKQHRSNYLVAKSKLEAAGLGEQEQALFVTLADIDRKNTVFFNEAVDLASQFNTDQAAVVTTTKIDPLLVEASAALKTFIDLQRRRTDEAVQVANERNSEMIYALVISAIVILAMAIVLAWRTKNSIREPLNAALDATTKIALGDLTTTILDEGRDEAALLLKGIIEMRDRLAKLVTQVRTGSESVATASAEIAQGNQDLSSRTENQASALEEMAASMEELSSTVKQNAENASIANQLAQNASAVAMQGGGVVGQVVETMKGINQSSRKIADIISVIDSIAFQTNILALNASVEAARAGEQGRGFAVVASEVRLLAGRSADAAKEIKLLINTSVDRVEQGTAHVDKAGETMTEVVSSIRRVTDIMGEISEASTEQSLRVSQIGEVVIQMDQATQQNAALVEQMAAAASGLKSQAGDLVDVVAVFILNNNDSIVGRGVSLPMQNSVPVRGSERRTHSIVSAKPKLADQKPKSLTKTALVAGAKLAGAGDGWKLF